MTTFKPGDRAVAIYPEGRGHGVVVSDPGGYGNAHSKLGFIADSAEAAPTSWTMPITAEGRCTYSTHEHVYLEPEEEHTYAHADEDPHHRHCSHPCHRTPEELRYERALAVWIARRIGLEPFEPERIVKMEFGHVEGFEYGEMGGWEAGEAVLAYTLLRRRRANQKKPSTTGTTNSISLEYLSPAQLIREVVAALDDPYIRNNK